MGMCIVYRAIPNRAPIDLDAQAFGRLGILPLPVLLAPPEQREPLRRAVKIGDWGALLPAQPEPRVGVLAALDRLIMGTGAPRV